MKIWPKCRSKKARYFFIIVLVLHSILLAYIVLKFGNNVGQASDTHSGTVPKANDFRFKAQPGLLKSSVKSRNTDVKIVDVIGKAAIGKYFWNHIFNGAVKETLHTGWFSGKLKLDNVIYRYSTGATITIDSLKFFDLIDAILILNGRNGEKIATSKLWLDAVTQTSSLKNLGVILLGNEECYNSWFDKYMTKNGGAVSFVYFVYDIPQRDDETFYQWPLGVATYRSFPNLESTVDLIETPRLFKCNFMGTVYPNSSRVTLMNVLQSSNLRSMCKVKIRQTWPAKETESSKSEYQSTLTQSDLTLCPAGKNPETYRIYEAIASGSVPVVEDAHGRGRCRRGGLSPLRLLKQHGAPMILLQYWSQLPRLLQKEATLTEQQVEDRRRSLFSWYKSFKEKQKRRIHATVQRHFYHTY